MIVQLSVVVVSSGERGITPSSRRMVRTPRSKMNREAVTCSPADQVKTKCLEDTLIKCPGKNHPNKFRIVSRWRNSIMVVASDICREIYPGGYWPPMQCYPTSISLVTFSPLPHRGNWSGRLMYGLQNNARSYFPFQKEKHFLKVRKNIFFRETILFLIKKILGD